MRTLAKLLLGLTVLALPALSWAQEDEFLRPEQAYRYSTRVDGERVIVTWTIEPGYYLYKSRMAVSAAESTIQLEPDWPRGESHTDEFFGTQEIYRGTVEIPVAIKTALQRPATLALELRLQGCADAGLCYPPLRWKSDVALPASTAGTAAASPQAPTAATFSPAPSPASSPAPLRSLFKSNSNADEFLPPDQAFRFSADMQRPDAATLTWVIAEGYYLYKDQVRITTDSAQVQLGSPLMPPGKPKFDEYYGDTEVYYELLEASLPVARAAGSSGQLALEVSYQGCAEGGLCYNPITRTVALELPPTQTAIALPASSAMPTQASSAPGASLGTAMGAPLAEQDKLALLIRDGHLLAVLATFFGLGILLSLTPCVLPMIPILSGIIVGQGEKTTPLRGFSLAFTYVQGMALTYAAAGAVFVLAFKQAPQAFFQQPWIVVSFALLFVALALAMFGAYNLQLPSSLQTRLTSASNHQKSGTWVGTFVMGALSALVVTACVAPAIIAALSVISQTGQVARGAGALYATGLGMGVPLLIVGASAGSLLPRVGPWMDTIKSLFGVLFLGVAIYLLTPLLPGAVILLLWAALAVVTGFWIFSLTARDGSPIAAPVRGAGLISVVYGILLLIGAASGSRDPLQPLDQLRAGAGMGQLAGQHLSFQRVKTVADLEDAVQRAAAAGKPVMLDFYADWCASCKEMEKYTFTDPAVRAALANVVLLQADVTANDKDDQALLERFEIFGPPTIAFFGADGIERKNFRLVGFSPAERFHQHVTSATSS